MNRQIAASLRLSGLLLLATGASAEETVARWVDAGGVTHFGNVQLAPPHAELQIVGAANGMDAPESRSAASSNSGPAWSLISRPPKQNPRGWRAKGDGVNYGPVSHSSGRGGMRR